MNSNSSTPQGGGLALYYAESPSDRHLIPTAFHINLTPLLPTLLSTRECLNLFRLRISIRRLIGRGHGKWGRVLLAGVARCNANVVHNPVNFHDDDWKRGSRPKKSREDPTTHHPTPPSTDDGGVDELSICPLF